DPEGMGHARTLMPDVAYAEDAYACAEGADALVIVTEWNAFRALDLGRLGKIMNARIMVDLRNIYRPQDVRGKGFTYRGIGTEIGASQPTEA
ncbi:UDP binding domain-containing protein, partial [Methylobacterium sp. J-070]|uniref:UDP binding domain-containing protein n=1 Tax=Methylobacterium sp. J-070 TaxID=2836650 RepID=UPI00244527D5